MLITRLSLALFLSFVMLATLPSQAAAAPIVFRFRGELAPATWGMPIPMPSPQPPPIPMSPLTVLLLPIQGQFTMSQGQRQQGIMVLLMVMMRDQSGTPTLNFTGTANLADFTVGARLTSADLQATVFGFDAVSVTPKSITVTVSWTGMGPLAQLRGSFSFRTDGSSLAFRFMAIVRPAVAVGSLAGDVALNLGPSTGALIGKASFGAMIRAPIP